MSKNIGIVLGGFHRAKVEEMLDEARRTAKELGLNVAAEVWVNGSVEKPLALKRLLQRDDIDGAVALGIIERGETKHGLVMGAALMQTIMQLTLEFMKPIGYGVLGPEILPEQIPSRLWPYARQAVMAMNQMLAL